VTVLHDDSSLILLIVSAALVILGVYLFFRLRKNPPDREQRRRLAVNLHGRLGDAMITEVQDNVIFYEYSVRGVVYTASQDVSKLREHIPIDPDRLIGPVGLKYSSQNPANSIIICEQWSGLRLGTPTQS
jgi:hypothetical protein